jgi:hypothetical protein
VDIGLIGINKYAKFLNFACDVHAFAFQKYLEQQGYSATFLDYKPAYYNNFNMRHPAKSAEASYRRGVEKKLSGKELEKLADIAVGYRSATVERERRFDKFQAFEKNNLKFTDEVYDSDLLEIKDPGFDCYMCVTDVIWQNIASHDFDRGFLLGSKAFEGKSKIAYAASRGASKDFNDRQAKIFFDYLQDIDDISIREQDFGEYIRRNSSIDPVKVIDPVLLHDKEFWQGVAVPPVEEKYVLLYYVMEQSTDTIAKAVEYAKLHDLTLVELSDRPFKYGKVTDPDVKHVARYDVGPDEWLGYIENAECVFTNSFHGCCFSVIFERPFFVGKRNGEKVPNFLATFGFMDRQFTPDADVNEFPGSIDFGRVPELLQETRKASEEFIHSALAKAQQKVDAGKAIDHQPYEQRRHKLEYPVNFNSGVVDGVVRVRDEGAELSSKRVPSGAIEYNRPKRRYVNNGNSVVEGSRFEVDGLEFAGWTLRFRVDNRWFWYLQDGSIATSKEVESGKVPTKAIIRDKGTIPYLPVNRISVAVFTAEWAELDSFESSQRRGFRRLVPTWGSRN